jgi:hypothetical protein
MKTCPVDNFTCHYCDQYEGQCDRLDDSERYAWHALWEKDAQHHWFGPDHV